MSKLTLRVDHCDHEQINGWALDAAEPARRLVFDLFIDGRFHSMIFARRLRGDLVKAGIGDGSGTYGFVYRYSRTIRCKGSFTLELREPGGLHTLHRSLITDRERQGTE